MKKVMKLTVLACLLFISTNVFAQTNPQQQPPQTPQNPNPVTPPYPAPNLPGTYPPNPPSQPNQSVPSQPGLQPSPVTPNQAKPGTPGVDTARINHVPMTPIDSVNKQQLPPHLRK